MWAATRRSNIGRTTSQPKIHPSVRELRLELAKDALGGAIEPTSMGT